MTQSGKHCGKRRNCTFCHHECRSVLIRIWAKSYVDRRDNITGGDPDYSSSMCSLIKIFTLSGYNYKPFQIIINMQQTPSKIWECVITEKI